MITVKNRANTGKYTKFHLAWSVTENEVAAERIMRAMRFIEQCPLKIKRIKIDGFDK